MIIAYKYPIATFAAAAICKSFLVLFFKKELLPSIRYVGAGVFIMAPVIGMKKTPTSLRLWIFPSESLV